MSAVKTSDQPLRPSLTVSGTTGP